MTLDLANLPSDLTEASPQRDPDPDQASEPTNEPACELAPEATTPPAASPTPQETLALPQEPSAVYPRNHFIHSLYGGFMNMPDLPGACLRADLWDSFVVSYTSPNFLGFFNLPPVPNA
ncbi:MAG TPA: hypothetical protein VNW54_05285 [Granulicella sp.]|jgi:hypothetical protein|nr:hypothetical protein [Granulicella sp.]